MDFYGLGLQLGRAFRAEVYPQKDYGGPFEIQVVPVDVGPDQVDWIASRTAGFIEAR